MVNAGWGLGAGYTGGLRPPAFSTVGLKTMAGRVEGAAGIVIYAVTTGASTNSVVSYGTSTGVWTTLGTAATFSQYRQVFAFNYVPPSATATGTSSSSATPSATHTAMPSISAGASPSGSSTATATASVTALPSGTGTTTGTASTTPSITPSSSTSPTATLSTGASPSPSPQYFFAQRVQVRTRERVPFRCGVLAFRSRAPTALPCIRFSRNRTQVLRAAGTTSAATPLFIDEYDAVTAAQGTPTRIVAMPTVKVGTQWPCTQSGSAGSDGYGTVSLDGTAFVFGCYGAPAGTGSVTSASSTAARVVAVVNASGAVDTSTAVLDSTLTNWRGAAAVDGYSGFWAASGSLGVRYFSGLGATTATAITSSGSLRTMATFDHPVDGPSLWVGGSGAISFLGSPEDVTSPTTPQAVRAGVQRAGGRRIRCVATVPWLTHDPRTHTRAPPLPLSRSCRCPPRSPPRPSTSSGSPTR